MLAILKARRGREGQEREAKNAEIYSVRGTEEVKTLDIVETPLVDEIYLLSGVKYDK